MFFPGCLGIAFAIWLALLPGFAQSQERKEGGGEKALLIGLIPEQNIFKQIERYAPLAEYLSKKVGVPVRLKVLTRYGNIIDNFSSSGLDAAFFGSFTYALAHLRLGVEVLARPEALDGTSTYHGLIFVRKDSGIKNVKSMKGKRLAFVDKATTAGFLFPLAYLMRSGVADYKTYFREAYFAGTHEAAIQDVLNRKADIGSAKNTVFERMAQADKTISRDLVVLAKSANVPENALAVRRDLDAALKRALLDSLLSMGTMLDGQPILLNFGAKKFIPTTDKEYWPVIQYSREINLDLTTYDYMNE
jgi:phosphonate transport system substrate-binding protein